MLECHFGTYPAYSAFSLRRVPILAFEMGLYDERQVDDIKHDHDIA